MQRSNAFALSIVTGLCLLTALGLTACAPNLKPRASEPMPPVVACAAGPAELIPPIPSDPNLEAEWMLKVMSLYEGEIEKRAAVMACLTELKSNGVIR